MAATSPKPKSTQFLPASTTSSSVTPKKAVVSYPIVSPTLPHNLQRYETLLDILSYKRSYDSYGELAVIMKYIIPIPGVQKDKYGNYWIKQGDAPVLWSCHTDTVHRMDKEDRNDIRQKLAVTQDGMIWSQDGSCLGADNGVGIWLMLKMLEAGVEGLYVFHREEEIGGLGSRDFARTKAKMLKDYKYAIAFDRRRTTSVITHQGWRTCSDAFADSLIEQLGMGHKKDDGGTFTDTKSYADIIPECTNISAGFEGEHSAMEQLDIQYVGRLLDALLKVDLSQLKCERDTTKKEYPKNYWHSYGGGYVYQNYGRGRATQKPIGIRNATYYDGFNWDDYDESEDEDDDTLMVRSNPDIVRELLEEWGIYDAFMDEIRVRTIFGG